jgi:molybdate transport system substrate-binding protein
MLGMYLTISPNANLQAAELQVLTGGGMTAPLKELGAQFESASGHKLVFRFGTTPELIKLATSGDPFDLAVVPREVFKDAAAQSQLVAGPYHRHRALVSVLHFARALRSPTLICPKR